MEGKLLAEKFLINRKLGEGAAGEVYEAILVKDTDYGKENQKFAIKIYRPWVVDKKDQAIRITRELKYGKNISSDHVVKSFEVNSENDNLFLVMELLKGITLTEWLKGNKQRNFPIIKKIMLEISEGINAIHNNNLIHRDIKPDNIMITDRGAVIMDLGVIKDLRSSYTITGNIFLGTIKYAAPEYLAGKNYNKSIDVYSFGVLLYEIITGKSFIDDKLYWTEQIEEIIKLLRNNNNAYFWYFDNDIYRKFTINIIKFSEVLLRHTISPPKYRFNVKRIQKALKENIWEKGFNVGSESVGKYVIKDWTNVPIEVKNKIEIFYKSKKLQEKIQKKYGECIEILTFKKPGTLIGHYGRICSIHHKGKRLGLIELDWHSPREKEANLSNLAWQLIFLGYFNFS